MSFLHLAIEFGWGGYLLGSPNAAELRFSHDGWIKISSTQIGEHEQIRPKVIRDLKERKLSYRIGTVQ